MAYKVMIIDDEPLAREGLRSMCDWSSEGFEIVAEASSTEEAHHFIEKNRVDLVLTDIVMSGESGLGLLRRLAEEYPETQRIVISCHDRFEYATESMRAGAIDYLFKLSLDEGALRGALRKAAGRLDQLRPVEERRESGFRRVPRPVRPDSTGVPDSDAQDVGIIALGPGNCSWSESTNRYLLGLLGEFTSLVRLRPEGSDLRLLIFMPLSRRDTMRVALLLWYHLRETSEPALSVHFRHGVWNSEACAAAAEALLDTNGFAHLFPQGSLVAALPPNSAARGGLSLDEGEELRKLVRSWRLYEACAMAVDILEGRARYGLSFALLRSTATEILWTLRQELPSDSPGQTSNVEGRLISAQSLLALTVAATYPVVRHITSSEHFRGLRGSESVSRVCTYLADNLSRRITLEEAAEVANMSPSYLSTRFKEVVGESFVHYSNRIRIEAAARMLASGVDVQEVAERFGYYDQSYFYRLFKRVTGITPGTAAGKSGVS